MWTEERNGKLRYFERYSDPKTGRLRKVSVTLPKKNDKKAAALLQAKIAEATKTIGEFTLQNVADAYLAGIKPNVAAATYKRNEYAINSITEILGGYNLIDRITAGYVRKQLLDSNKKPKTCNEFIHRFSTFIRWAYRNDMISSTECIDKLTRFKTKPHREEIAEKFLNGPELSALLDSMTDEGNRLVTEFLALSGLRIGELIALEDADVTDVINVNKSYSLVAQELTPGKTLASRREVFIQPELADCIKRLRAFMRRRKLMTGASGSPLFIINRKGERFQYFAYNKYFAEHTEKLGRRLTVHSLRHTHASLLMEAGYPLDAISRRLGHENSEITRKIYLHITEGMKKRDAELMSAISLLPPTCPQFSPEASAVQ